MGRCAVAFHVTRFKTLGVLRRSLEGNIKIGLQEVGWEVVGACKCANELSDAIKRGELLDSLRTW